MTAQTGFKPRTTRYGVVEEILRDQSVAALTTGTAKGRWLVPCFATILDVICNSGTAGSGGTSDIIDVNLNGTTIFTTQANRPTLLVGDTGLFSLSGLGVVQMPPEVTSVVPNDIITWDVDQICTTGSALFTIAIVLAKR